MSKLFSLFLLFSSHTNILIDGAVQAVIQVFTTLTGAMPKFKAHGGGNAENLALQNIQVVFKYVKLKKVIISCLVHFRHVSEWFWPISLLNYCYGLKSEIEDFLFWELQMWMKGHNDNC